MAEERPSSLVIMLESKQRMLVLLKLFWTTEVEVEVEEEETDWMRAEVEEDLL